VNDISKSLIAAGAILILIGLIWHFSKGQFPLGKLPGDFHLKGQNYQIFIPLTSSLLVSLIFSLILYFFRR